MSVGPHGRTAFPSPGVERRSTRGDVCSRPQRARIVILSVFVDATGLTLAASEMRASAMRVLLDALSRALTSGGSSGRCLMSMNGSMPHCCRHGLESTAREGRGD